MIGIETIVYFVFAAIIIAGIIALLWFAIGYCESKFGGLPMAWSIVRVVFVLLCVFMLISFLLYLLGHPVVRF